MKVAIIGADGQLGSELTEEFGNEAIGFTIKDLDVTNYESLEVIIKENPDIIINTAGYVKVAEAENNVKECFDVNAIGALNVAKICNKIDAINIYIGTDYVFDGKKGTPYNERDIPNPLNVYGASKYVGEILTRNYCDKYYILRIASLFGKGSIGKQNNFVYSIIERAKRGEEIKVVGDITMSPTYARDVASNLRKFLYLKPEYGIYHFNNSGGCTWYDFAVSALKILNIEANVKKITMIDLNENIKRPAFTVLDNGKIKSIGIEARDWKEALREYLKKHYM